MNPYVLIVFILNAHTLQPLKAETLGVYDTPQACLEAQAGRVEKPKDGTLRYYVCRKDTTKIRS